jgi:hypothetical protein
MQPPPDLRHSLEIRRAGLYPRHLVEARWARHSIHTLPDRAVPGRRASAAISCKRSRLAGEPPARRDQLARGPARAACERLVCKRMTAET